MADFTRHNWHSLNIPKDRYVIDTRYFYQFATGVTGETRTRTIFTTPEGFKTKKEAREFMKSIGLKPYRRKGRKDYGYGSVGAESLRVDIIPAELIKESRYDWISSTQVYKEGEAV